MCRNIHVLYNFDPPSTEEEVRARLDDVGVRSVWLVGGGELAGSFARAGMITRYVISVIPVLLGDGVRLLGRQGASARLRLESSTRFGDVVQQVYRPVDQPGPTR